MNWPGSGFICIIIAHTFSGVVPGQNKSILTESSNELLTEAGDFIVTET